MGYISTRSFIYEFFEKASKNEDLKHHRSGGSVHADVMTLPNGERTYSLFSYAEAICRVTWRLHYPSVNATTGQWKLKEVWRNHTRYSVTTSKHQTWTGGAYATYLRPIDPGASK
jgi:hypothetical protein